MLVDLRTRTGRTYLAIIEGLLLAEHAQDLDAWGASVAVGLGRWCSAHSMGHVAEKMKNISGLSQ